MQMPPELGKKKVVLKKNMLSQSEKATKYYNGNFIRKKEEKAAK